MMLTHKHRLDGCNKKNNDFCQSLQTLSQSQMTRVLPAGPSALQVVAPALELRESESCVFQQVSPSAGPLRGAAGTPAAHRLT